MVFFTLAQGGQEGDGLRHLQQGFALIHEAHACRVIYFATAALGHPVDEIHHIGPTRGGEFFAFLAVVQMLFVVQVFQPLGK